MMTTSYKSVVSSFTTVQLKRVSSMYSSFDIKSELTFEIEFRHTRSASTTNKTEIAQLLASIVFNMACFDLILSQLVIVLFSLACFCSIYQLSPFLYHFYIETLYFIKSPLVRTTNHSIPTLPQFLFQVWYFRIRILQFFLIFLLTKNHISRFLLKVSFSATKSFFSYYLDRPGNLKSIKEKP